MKQIMEVLGGVISGAIFIAACLVLLVLSWALMLPPE